MQWREKLRRLSILLLFPVLAFGSGMPVQDNILFAFDRCKTLSVDLKTGNWQESFARPFDLHCKRSSDDKFQLNCDFFATDSSKKLSQEVYKGGTDLGAADLSGPSGKKIRFLLGYKFASLESPSERMTCAGIYLFEQEALKKKKQ